MVSELVGVASADVRRTVSELGSGAIEPGAAVEAVVCRLRRLGEELAYGGSRSLAGAVFELADRERAAGVTADVLPRLEELVARLAGTAGRLSDGEQLDARRWS